MYECPFFLPKLKSWHKRWKIEQNQLLNFSLYTNLETGLKIFRGGLWVPYWPIWKFLNRESLQMSLVTWGRSPLYMIMITDCTRITTKTTQNARKDPCIINIRRCGLYTYVFWEKNFIGYTHLSFGVFLTSKSLVKSFIIKTFFRSANQNLIGIKLRQET